MRSTPGHAGHGAVSRQQEPLTLRRPLTVESALGLRAMNILRWLVMAPVAFGCCIVAGASAYFAYTGLLGFPAWQGHLASGATSGLVFVYVGLRVAPSRSRGVQWALAVVGACFGAFSTAGGVMSGSGTSLASGSAMLLFSIVAGSIDISGSPRAQPPARP
jgi:hypothetical protein